MTNSVIVMESSSNLRALGRDALKDKWMEAVLVVMIFCVLTEIPVIILDSVFGGSMFDTVTNGYNPAYGGYTDVSDAGGYSMVSSIYLLVVSGPLTYGISLFFLNLFRNSGTEISTIMVGFEKFGKTFLLALYMSVFIFLWALLFLIPGVIAAIKYSQSFFILADNPEMSIPEIVNESKRLMAGNKGKYFCYNLSFIGWIILAAIPAGTIGALAAVYINSYFVTQICTFIGGVGLFWVFAYLRSTGVAFYQILTGRLRADTYDPGEY
ncbi:MAG: DUF975 family protein [Eubacteriaceae bacterium]|nr:DUF975 family protein [Eubacteriaceae bacterium]